MFSINPDGLVEDYTIVNESKIYVVFTIDNNIAYSSIIDGF